MKVARSTWSSNLTQVILATHADNQTGTDSAHNRCLQISFSPLSLQSNTLCSKSLSFSFNEISEQL